MGSLGDCWHNVAAVVITKLGRQGGQLYTVSVLGTFPPLGAGAGLLLETCQDGQICLSSKVDATEIVQQLLRDRQHYPYRAEHAGLQAQYQTAQAEVPLLRPHPCRVRRAEARANLAATLQAEGSPHNRPGYETEQADDPSSSIQTPGSRKVAVAVQVATPPSPDQTAGLGDHALQAWPLHYGGKLSALPQLQETGWDKFPNFP